MQTALKKKPRGFGGRCKSAESFPSIAFAASRVPAVMAEKRSVEEDGHSHPAHIDLIVAVVIIVLLLLAPDDAIRYPH